MLVLNRRKRHTFRIIEAKAPFELLDDAYHGMEQQIETENAVREVKEEFEAPAAVLEVKLYEFKMARMSDWRRTDNMSSMDDSTDELPL